MAEGADPEAEAPEVADEPAEAALSVAAAEEDVDVAEAEVDEDCEGEMRVSVVMADRGVSRRPKRHVDHQTYAGGHVELGGREGGARGAGGSEGNVGEGCEGRGVSF